MHPSLSAATILTVVCASASLMSQTRDPGPDTPVSTLHITSRAVLVDVLVTDKDGKPVKGLKQDAFRVTEQGKPQAITYFEEQTEAPKGTLAALPALPPNVFCNFSPNPSPSAVNVLLLDSLNTALEDQIYVHKQAMTFLKNLKPGSRMAIFSMSMGLKFVQGFTDDPAVLVSSLGSTKRNEVEVSSLMKTADEGNAQTNLIGEMQRSQPAGNGGTTTTAPQAMIDDLIGFFAETDVNEETDRAYRTLANLQQLAAFLGAFPGRKNVIWFSESFPLRLFGDSTMRLDDEIKKTVNLLTAARVAVYPVDARGVRTNVFYEAGDTATPSPSTSQMLTGVGGVQTTSLIDESNSRGSDQVTMNMLAHDSGGKAYANTNGLAEVIGDVQASSADFYTISYAPTNQKIDESIRHIDVRVEGGKYNLSYRHSYYASDAGLPGTGRSGAAGADLVQGVSDPLRPFMDFGMPQSEQILYKALIKPLPSGQEMPGEESKGANRSRYGVDFAVDLKDLNLQLDADGLHKGTLNLSLVVFDRYGHVVSRKDHLVELTLKPDVYALFQTAGVQLHAVIDAPRGQYWLRTGVYDQASHKAGTLEIPISQVRAPEMASK